MNGSVVVKASTVETDPSSVYLSVSDSGWGIPTESLSRVFEHLYQDSNAVDGNRKGLGLGLYIAKEIISLHVGRMWVASQPGSGSTFSFTLPFYSLGKLLTPVITYKGRLREDIVLVCVKLNPVSNFLRGSWKETCQRSLDLLRLCIYVDKDLVLPPMGSSGPVTTFFVVASTDMARAGILMNRIRDQVGALPELRVSGTLQVTAEMIPMPPAAGPGILEQQILVTIRPTQREIQELNSELEDKVARRTSQLETANKELESFSYSVSHDLRAPLRHISGFSKMLEEELGAGLSPDARHYLDRIQTGIQKMGLLVDELLNLARVGRHVLRPQPSQMNSIVADVIAMFQPDSAGRHVEWLIADLPIVECDAVLVKQVFQNLLANALKFTRRRGHVVIEVNCKKEDGQLVFMVRDNGVGFNMKYVDKLFGAFQRLHSADEFEGTGIGLVTVQRIVQKHGGRVWARRMQNWTRAQPSISPSLCKNKRS
jgi:signal transduction histidine kinase